MHSRAREFESRVQKQGCLPLLEVHLNIVKRQRQVDLEPTKLVCYHHVMIGVLLRTHVSPLF
jgi:hypothetical protein